MIPTRRLLRSSILQGTAQDAPVDPAGLRARATANKVRVSGFMADCSRVAGAKIDHRL